MFSFSANCAWVSFFSLRHLAINFPISIWFIIFSPFSLNDTPGYMLFTQTNGWIGEIQPLVGKYFDRFLYHLNDVQKGTMLASPSSLSINSFMDSYDEYICIRFGFAKTSSYPNPSADNKDIFIPRIFRLFLVCRKSSVFPFLWVARCFQIPDRHKAQYSLYYPMKRFVKCFFAVRMKRSKAGQDWKNPFPRFRRRNGNVKNPDGQGFKNGDFSRPVRKNTIRP